MELNEENRKEQVPEEMKAARPSATTIMTALRGSVAWITICD